LFGGLSVILAGFASDRLGERGRPLIIFYGLLSTTATLLVLALADFRGSQTAPVILVTLVAFVMIGPYSYLAGAIALDFGGKQGSATASGLIDGIGYLGGVLAGNTVAGISVVWGWKGAFATLAAVALLSGVAARFYLMALRRRSCLPCVTGVR
jgi:OPA family glycerol-3-phosphate transporter-like MFS transporter